MRFEEMIQKYRNQWLLIEIGKLDNEGNIISGEVLLHSPSKDEIYRNMLKFKGRNLAIEYVGDLPKDMAIMI